MFGFRVTCRFLVGNKGMYYIITILFYSLLTQVSLGQSSSWREECVSCANTRPIEILCAI